MDLADHRRDYSRLGLREEDLAADPFDQFRRWFAEAQQEQVIEPNAMTLATCTPDGRPSARIVLLKDVSPRGFAFFTNYDGRKSQELEANPHAALVFYWGELERQVRIEGTVERTTVEESDAYFQRRPRGSQLGAWTSQQSSVVAGRHVLEQKLAELEVRFAEGQVTRPPFWGGYRLKPTTIEFWQGRPNRLHDRLRYRLLEGDGTAWVIERLAP